MDTKKCLACKEEKPFAQYTIIGSGKNKGKPRSKCKACRTLEHKEYKKRDPSIYRRVEWPSKLKRLYGITVDDYYKMLEEQGGGCAICKTKVPSQRKRKYVDVEMFFVDHCHSTGKVRGLLCSKCNRAVGLFDDDIGRLNAAAAYLGGSRNG